MNKRIIRLILAVAWLASAGGALFAAAVPVTPLWAGLTNNSGQPLSPGRVYFYVPGTTTAKNVWDEATKVTARTYVDLDAYGRAQVYGDGIYKLTVCDRTTGSDVTLYSIDNLEVQTATTSTSISPTTATIASATITTLTANGGTINSTTINSPTIVGGTTNGTTFANGSISSSTITTSTLTSPTISGGAFSGSQTGMSINSPTIVSPVITGTGTAALSSATITNLTVTTLTAAGLSWSGIGLVGVSITGASTITGATLEGCTINNPTFGGTTGAGTLKNLTLLEGPTSSYSGLAIAKPYVDEHMLDNSTHGCSVIASGASITTETNRHAYGAESTITGAGSAVLGTGMTDVTIFTLTNSDTVAHYYLIISPALVLKTDVSTDTVAFEVQLTDGTVRDWAQVYHASGVNNWHPFTLSGVIGVAGSTSVSVKIQGQANYGASYLSYSGPVRAIRIQ